MRLLLCEKPSQARDIARVLGAGRRGDGCLAGDGVTVTWCVGHLLEMAPPDAYDPALKQWCLESLPILPQRWLLEPRRDGAKQLRVIERLLRGAGEVVIATDADREGEMIAREVLERCGWRGPTLRAWLSALDDASIRKAFAALLPGAKTEPLYRAGLARSRADWLVGMNLTRAYTVLGRAGGQRGVLSVGRVQTPTLRLVVDRDREIEAFVPAPFWELVVICTAGDGARFRAAWRPRETASDPSGRCINEQAARDLAQRVRGRTARVVAAATERKREAPPLPFDLGTLQQEASRRWGMGAKEVLDAAQALYETHKATTYPRTDCPYLPESMRAEIPQVLDALVRSDPQLERIVKTLDRAQRSRAWNDAKITAHHAIIPTACPCDPSRMREPERRLYDLIRRRYLAQFLPRHEYDATRVELMAEGETFEAKGRRIVTPGWRVLFGRDPGDKDGEQELPPLRENDRCTVGEAVVTACQTKPPARFTEGTLIGAMKHASKWVQDPWLKALLRDTAGLGTEATRAGIIQTLLERGFVEKRKKALVSTPPGRALIDALPAPVKDPATTALWEQALDDIAQGRGDLDEFLREQAEWVRQLVERARASRPIALAAATAAEPGPPCPECGEPLQRRRGTRGFFWGCSGYPGCRITLPDAGGKPGARPRGAAPARPSRPRRG